MARADGTLTLSGRLAPAARTDVAAAVRAAFPSASLSDNLASGADDPAMLADLPALLKRLADLPSGMLLIETGRARLSGDAPDPDAYERATAPLETARLRLDTDAVRPPLIASYTFVARRTAEALVLDGFAPTRADRDALEAEARRIGPAVAGHLKVGRPPDGFDALAAARFVLAQAAQLTTGEASLRDGRLTVAGTAPDREARDALQQAARQGAAGLAVARFAVETAPLSVYAFSLHRADGRLRLAGYLPDQAARTRLREAARDRFLGLMVEDATRLADGAPPGLEAAAMLALDNLSLLAKGEARLEGRSIVLSGDMLYPQAADRMRRDVAKAAPPGWTARAEVGTAAERRAGASETCGRALDRLLAETPLRFEADKLAPSSAETLRRVAAIAAGCPESRIEISALIDNVPPEADAVELSRRRARLVAEALVREGVGTGRVSALGRGAASKPEEAARAVEIRARP
ncbi:MAG TPA: OmpA family protein [Beijerinckiaceae bacterium]